MNALAIWKKTNIELLIINLFARNAKKGQRIVHVQDVVNQLLADMYLIVVISIILNALHALSATEFLMARTLLSITTNTIAQNMVSYT